MIPQLFNNLQLLRNNRIPGQVVIQFTNHCNAHCPQCGMRTTAKIPRSRLETDEIKRIIDAAAERGMQAVSFTGGEPFLFQDDLIKLIDYAGQAGIPYIRTGTNGFTFRGADRSDFSDRIKALADKLAATSLRNFWISLDSALPEVHEQMRGLPGVVSGIEKAIPIFHNAGLFPSVNLGLNRMVGGDATATLTPQYYASNDEYLAVFGERFRVAMDRFYHLVRDLGFSMVNTCYPMSVSTEESDTGLRPVYEATTADAVVNFSTAEKAELFKVLLDIIPKHRSDLRIFSPLSSIYILNRHYMNTIQPTQAASCRGGVDFFFVDAKDGDTYPCGYRGNENLGKLWQLDLSTVKTDGNCLKCDWECFRDPSELFAPLLQFFNNPGQLITTMAQDKIYRRLWLEDIRYYRACGYFDGRIKTAHNRLRRFKTKTTGKL